MNNEQINKIVWVWFVDARPRNLPLSGPTLQVHAKQITETLVKDDFHASNRQLKNFRKRQDIEICGETGNKAVETGSAWTKKLEKFVEEYEPHKIANAEGSGLY